jgi:hypothetical protein
MNAPFIGAASLRHWLAQRPVAIALILILIASLRIVSTYRALSQTTDEPAHLAAGIEWIQSGTYTYEDQHPPLARVTGALGIYFAGSRWSRNADMYDEGYHLLGQNKRYTRALFFSRLFMLPFFWIGAAAVYLWGLRIGGSRTAVLSTLLFTTMPTVLAHAGLVTTDMALTAFVSATLVASLYWVSAPGWRTSAVLGIALGFALLSKFSALVFLPVTWALMFAAHLLNDRRGFLPPLKRAARLIPWAALSAVIAMLLVWAGYRFAIGRVDYLNARLPAPSFFTGIQYVYLHNREGHPAYLLGQRSHIGFWYYYPVVLAVKTPLAALPLMVAGIWLAMKRRNRLPIEMPLALTAALLGIGLFSHINIGVRHILPIYTAFALCGGAVLDRMFRARRARISAAAVILLLWQVTSGALVHPDYLAYTNELAGSHPERILVDSDLDWGQGMRGLALRLEQLGVQDLTFQPNDSGYLIATRDIGRPFPRYKLMPDGDKPQPGWNAVSVTAWKLSGQPKWAERIEPAEKIHRSIYLYYFPPAK